MKAINVRTNNFTVHQKREAPPLHVYAPVSSSNMEHRSSQVFEETMMDVLLPYATG